MIKICLKQYCEGLFKFNFKILKTKKYIFKLDGLKETERLKMIVLKT